jgi:competence transcription factor ComK
VNSIRFFGNNKCKVFLGVIIMSNNDEISIHHSVEDIDNKYKDKSIYRDTYFGYDDHSDAFTALNNQNMSTPFPFTDRDYPQRL